MLCLQSNSVCVCVCACVCPCVCVRACCKSFTILLFCWSLRNLPLIGAKIRPRCATLTKVQFNIEIQCQSFIHSFIQTIPIASLQVHFYSEALPTQHGYCAIVSCRSATGNCELRTCPRSLRGG